MGHQDRITLVEKKGEPPGAVPLLGFKHHVGLMFKNRIVSIIPQMAPPGCFQPGGAPLPEDSETEQSCPENAERYHAY